jgi:hypothetical protein
VHPPPLGLPLPWQLGALRPHRGLALQGKSLPDLYLRFRTLPGFTGAGLVTLVSWVGDGAEMPLLRQLQVSISLFLLYINLTDMIEVAQAHPGPFRAIFPLSLEGGKKWKNRDCARSRRTVVLLFWEIIIASIFKGIAPFPHCRSHVYCFGGCGHIGAKIGNCDPTRQVLVSPLHFLILMMYTSKLL